MIRRDDKDSPVIGAAIILMALLSLCILMSCSTKKTITETVYVHDTIYHHSTDTVVSERVVHHNDTVRVSEEKVITLIQREEGRVDTVRIDTARDTYKSSELTDELKQLHNAVDSLSKAVSKEHVKEVLIYKKPLWKTVIIVSLVLILLIAGIRILIKITNV